MNKILALAIAGLISITMTGCSGKSVVTEIKVPNTDLSTEVNIENTKEDSKNEDAYYISPTDEIPIDQIIVIGDIMQFDNKYIHIISGDIVEVFEYDNANEKDFYIGQTVQLVRGEKNNLLENFEKENYTISHTNMGQTIEQITATVEKINNKIITLKKEDQEVEIKTYEAIEASIGDQVTVYTIDYGEGKSALMTLNESRKLDLSIKEISREDNGTMLLLLNDSKEGNYAINVSQIVVEFDISKLEIGDELKVYYKGGIMESDPMQLDTILIRK